MANLFNALESGRKRLLQQRNEGAQTPAQTVSAMDKA
jgi:hypothetical protein